MNGENQYEADIAAAKVLGGYDNVVVVNNPCFCGGFDGIDETGQVDQIARVQNNNISENQREKEDQAIESY